MTWTTDTNLLVECLRCERRAIVLLTSYEPTDPPRCQFPNELETDKCMGRLRLLAAAPTNEAQSS